MYTSTYGSSRLFHIDMLTSSSIPSAHRSLVLTSCFFPRSCSSVILLLYTLPLLQHLYMNCNQDDQLEFPDNVMQLLHKRPCPFNNLTDLVILVCRTLPA